MHVMFDALDRFEVPQFVVCNPGSVYIDDAPTNVLGVLSGTNSEELVLNFNATSELNFRVDKMRSEDADVDTYLLKLYKSLQNRRLIFIDNIGYFVITKVVDGYDGVFHYKDITAESCEIEIRNKQIPFIGDGTYNFEDLLNTLVELLPSWTVGEIADSVKVKYRTFEDVSETLNMLGFMLEKMQDAYECIFVFDCINRVINVYDQNNYVRLTDIQISKDDVVNSLDITESSDDLFTALSASGGENISIAPVNPLGTAVVYNFNYYLDWMTDSLREKVSEWISLIEAKEQEYYDINLQYYTLWTERDTYETKYNAANAQIDMYSKCIDNMAIEYDKDTVLEYIEALELSEDVVKEIDGDIESIKDDVDAVKEYIIGLKNDAIVSRDTAKTKIDEIDSEMGALKEQSNTINDECAISNYFTYDEYEELYNYIYEGTYSDDYVITTESMTYAEKFEQMKTLYDRAKSQLLRVSYPTQEFNLDVENFIFEKDFAEWSEQLQTGVLINVELDVDDVAALFLSNITVNYDDQKLTMTFGNRFNKYDPKALFDKILGNVQKSANSINFIKDLLYPIKNGEYDAFKEFVETSRTLTKNAALAATNQSIVIDDTGYLGRKVDSEGNFEDEQLKITNNSIVFTDDAWDTCKTALGKILFQDGSYAYGLNAQIVVGDLIMGDELHILNSDFEDVFSVTDDKISGVIASVEEQNSKITEIEQTADEIKIKVESTNIASGVKTGKEFTLDDNGLRIADGSSIENLLDNTGMYVIKTVAGEEEEVLVANADGVKAIDITVKNFLTIGEHSRFEDYINENGKERTAAFWI